MMEINQTLMISRRCRRRKAIDRRRIAALEREEPQPMKKDRGEILRVLLAANGGKMLAKDACKRMHLSESRFSELLESMDDAIEKRPYHFRLKSEYYNSQADKFCESWKLRIIFDSIIKFCIGLTCFCQVDGYGLLGEMA